MENQRAFLDSIGEKIGVKDGDLTPWYTVSYKTLEDLGYNGLFDRYDKSRLNMLRTVYPEHEWLPWKFKMLPLGTERGPELARRILDYVEVELRFSEPSDWYQVTKTDLRRLAVYNLISEMGGLHHLLVQNRKDFEWDPDRLPKSDSKDDIS